MGDPRATRISKLCEFELQLCDIVVEIVVRISESNERALGAAISSSELAVRKLDSENSVLTPLKVGPTLTERALVADNSAYTPVDPLHLDSEWTKQTPTPENAALMPFNLVSELTMRASDSDNSAFPPFIGARTGAEVDAINVFVTVDTSHALLTP